jgi:hypothetical protein
MAAAFPYFASVVATLGWLYCTLAACWPRLFHREAVRHAARDALGYRLGWAIYWQLPARPAVLIAGLSTAPLVAAVLLPERWAAVVVGLAAAASLALWLTHPPGQRLGISASQPANGTPMFELRAARGFLRSILVLVAFGLAPAAVIGAGLSLLVSRLAR